MNKLFSMKILCLSVLFQSCIFSNDSKVLSKPYSELEEVLPFNNHGWYSNALWIQKLMKSNNVKTAIEVGSWLGLSTRHIASLLQPNGKVYAVDTWQGSVEHHEIHHYAVMLPTLYNQFLSNMIHANLTDIVIPVKMTSLEAAQILKESIKEVDLVYIDAAHDTYSVVLDLHAFWPYVSNNGGILCGDDWWHDPVKIAVRAFAQNYNLTIYASDNFWFVKNEGIFLEKDFKFQDTSIWKFEALQ